MTTRLQPSGVTHAAARVLATGGVVAVLGLLTAAAPATGPLVAAAAPATAAPAFASTGLAPVAAPGATTHDVPGPVQTVRRTAPTTTPPTTTGPTTTGPTTTGPSRSSSSSARAGGDASGAFYQADRAISVGQMLSSQGSCTATVITSTTGDVAVTAAHCVYWPATGPMADAFPTHGWAPLDQFIPGRTGDTTPYGRWQIERAWIDPRWRDTGDIAYDVAFLRIATLQGHHVQDVVGSQGIAFTSPAAGTAVTALGYPVEAPFDGRTLRRCWTSAVAIDPSSENALTMPCTMTPGSSGGPWLTGFNATTGAGTVVAVTSFHDDTNRQVSARPLGDVGYALYQSADQASTG